MDVFVDSRFEPLYERHPLVLVDVGARGGLRPNWAPAARHLTLIGFEPDRREYERLQAAPAGTGPARTIFPTALHEVRGPIPITLARDRGLTSIFEPNRAFLDAFPDADRWDTVDTQEVEADTLDHVLEAHGIGDIDFIKVDTQGSELLVLKGASRALDAATIGVEVEVEFSPIYSGQPLFADVDVWLRDRGFELFDLRPCYWKRASGRALGGPRGQIVWADALYLKRGTALRAAAGHLPPDARKSKLLKALSVSLLYGYVDHALATAKDAAEAFTLEEQALLEAGLRAAGRPHDPLPSFPGRGRLAAVLHRLWKVCTPRTDAWSFSRGKLGNLD